MGRIAIPVSFVDFEIMARTVFAEAGGEVYLGKIGVGWCIRTRAETDLGHDGKPDWWGEGIGGVCQKPAQFSCWLRDSPVYGPMVSAGTEKLAESLKACFAVLTGEIPDPTGGATHYLNPRKLVGKMPAWVQGRAPTAVLGNHDFYRLI